MKLFNWFLEQRLINGRTQVSVAQEVGVCAHHLSRVIGGHLSPSVALAHKLEKITNIPWHEIIDDCKEFKEYRQKKKLTQSAA